MGDDQFSARGEARAFGACSVDPARLEVRGADGVVRSLSKRQMNALLELIDHQGHVVPRARLHALLCRAAEGHRDRAALSHHVAAIRRALGDPTLLETVRGQGYSLRPPADASPAPVRPCRVGRSERRPIRWMTGAMV
ncbi:MAG: helix-turn-helix domain-containing protein, partial [Pseudomonadota bacterium]